MEDYIIWFDHLGMSDVDRVGGKNASLGEMISNLANAGVTVPGGFATTAHAYREFLAKDGLREKIDNALDALDINDVNELARKFASGFLIRHFRTRWKSHLRTPTQSYVTATTTSRWRCVRQPLRKIFRMRHLLASRRLSLTLWAWNRCGRQ